MEKNKQDQSQRPVIVLVGGDSPTVDRARSLGLDVFLIQTPARHDAALVANALGVLVIDYEKSQRAEIEAWATAIGRTHRIQCAVSLTEFGLLPAAWINETLGTPGVSSRAVELTRNKSAMREALSQTQPVPTVVARTAAEAERFAQQHGWPVILKPLDGAGSRAVHKAQRAQDLQSLAWNGDAMLVEPYVTGRLISVEAFSYAGQHVIYGVNEEFPSGADAPKGANPHVETAHQIPATLPPDTAADIERLVCATLTTLEVTDGPSHTEIIVHGGGLFLVETHTRPGGDFIPEMMQRCTGFDLLSTALAWPSGLLKAPVPKPQWQQGAALRFFLPDPGRVQRVSGVEAAADKPGVAQLALRVKAGDQIQPMLSSVERVGYVMVLDADAEAASRRCREVVAGIEIVVDGA